MNDYNLEKLNDLILGYPCKECIVCIMCEKGIFTKGSACPSFNEWWVRVTTHTKFAAFFDLGFFTKWANTRRDVIKRRT